MNIQSIHLPIQHHPFAHRNINIIMSSICSYTEHTTHQNLLKYCQVDCANRTEQSQKHNTKVVSLIESI